LPAGLLLQGHGGWRTGLLLGTAAGAANAIAVGFGMNAWGHWMIISRLWLPVTRRLPWDLIRFLKDAHERGVLRQAGAVYQFRHTRLQDTLAASDSNTRAVTHSPDPPRSQGHQPTATRTP